MGTVCLETGKSPGMEKKKKKRSVTSFPLTLLLARHPALETLPTFPKGLLSWEVFNVQLSTGSEFLAGPFEAKNFFPENSKPQEMM